MPATADLSPTDRALVAALSAWGGVEALPLRRRFGAQRGRALAGAMADASPSASLEGLRQAHAAQAQPDPARVHPSWLVRALQDESPAVRRAVAAVSSEPLRSTLLAGLGLGPDDLMSDHPADPRAVEIAGTLWTERLVGDLPPLPDDPPAIRALATLRPVGLYRLCRLCGLARRAIVPGSSAEGDRRLTRERFDALRVRFRLAGPIDARLVQIAANEWTAAGPLGRHRLAGLGLTTLGRLLAHADAYRVRWALQHVPYPVAKRLRAAASRPEARIRELSRLEARILDAAWDRLREEGRTA